MAPDTHGGGAASTSSSCHVSHLRDCARPPPATCSLTGRRAGSAPEAAGGGPAARVSGEGGGWAPAAVPPRARSGAQRAKGFTALPKGGRHRGTRGPTWRAGSLPRRLPTPSNPLRAPIRCRNGVALNATEPYPPRPPPNGAAHRPGTGTRAPLVGGVTSRGQVSISHRAWSPGRPHPPSPKAPPDGAKG